MPKGDIKILKADPEDGTTPIANLLLEAIAVSNLSGLGIRALLYLWRRTYGWVGDEKSRLKFRYIPLSEWASHLNTTSPRASVILKTLEGLKIIKRQSMGDGKGYNYGMNTHISEWDDSILSKQLLSKNITVIQNDNTLTITQTDNRLLPKTVIDVTQMGNSSITQNCNSPTLNLRTPKESIKKVLNKDIKKERTATSKNDRVATETEFLEYLEETRSQFPDLDCEVEFKKFNLWWSESGKKPKRPKTAWLNWLIKARQILAESDALAKARRVSAQGNERQFEKGEIVGPDRQDNNGAGFKPQNHRVTTDAERFRGIPSV
jgi:hypothetical protein